MSPKNATAELDKVLKGANGKVSPKAAKKAVKPAAKAAPAPKAPYSVHAMGLKDDVYTKVLDKTPCDSLEDALRLVEKWAEKDDIHEVSIHVR